MDKYERAIWHDKIEDLYHKVLAIKSQYNNIVEEAIQLYYGEKEYYNERLASGYDFDQYLYEHFGQIDENLSELYLSVGHTNDELEFNPKEIWFKLRNLHRELCRLHHCMNDGFGPDFRPHMINSFKPYGHYKL